MSKRPNEREQLSLFRALPGSDMALRDAQDLMAYPFFSLAKSPRIVPIRFEAGGISLTVEGVPEHGIATIWDADVLIWAASQIIQAKKEGIAPSRLMVATPYEILRFARRGTGRSDYLALRAALDRLQSTTVATTLRQRERPNGAMRVHRFSWINEWKEYVQPGGRSDGIELILADWFFSGVMLTASGSGMTQAQFLRPGQLAKVGIDAGRPIMAQISELTGFPEVFANLDVITVLFLAWLVLIVSFFVLAVQLFVTLIEFKLTTLAGFVLVPFALWNKTAFLAEKVLGNVISSGIKVLVLAVIVGIGSGLFAEFRTPAGAEPSIDHALVIMLAALAMLGLGIFGPGIATGLVSGAPQLGAGAAVGTAIGATGLAVAGGAAVAGAGSAVAAGARMAPGAANAAIGGGASAARSASALASGAKSGYQAGVAASGGTGVGAAGAGVRSVAKAGAYAMGQRVASSAKAVKDSVAGFVREAAAPTSTAAADTAFEASTSPPATEPAWAQRMRHRQQATHAATTAAHALRSGDHEGSGSGPSLRDDSNS